MADRALRVVDRHAAVGTIGPVAREQRPQEGPSELATEASELEPKKSRARNLATRTLRIDYATPQ